MKSIYRTNKSDTDVGDQGNFLQSGLEQISDLGFNHPVGVLVLSVLGLVVWILGYRLIKPIVIVAAFIFAGVSFYIFSPGILDTDFCCNGKHSLEVRISISIICGLISGALACYVYKTGVFCMGGIIGLVLSIVIVTLWVSRHVKSDLALYGIYIALALLFGILTVWQEKFFVVIATSVLGSLMFFLGLDHYCQTSFTTVINHLLFKTKDAFVQAANHPGGVQLDFHKVHDDFNKHCLAMFLGWLLMSVIGAILQYMYTAQTIDTDLFIKSCGCGGKDSAALDDREVRYVVLPPPRLRALLLHQTKRRDIIRDSWDDITAE